MAPIMGGLIELNQLCLLLWKTGHDKDNMPKNAMPASIAGLCNTVMYGVLTNGNWMITAGSAAIVTAVTLTFYSIMFNYIDAVTISILSNTLIFVGIALYKSEKRDK